MSAVTALPLGLLVPDIIALLGSHAFTWGKLLYVSHLYLQYTAALD